ncbi:MAG: ECF transporter S component [Dysosmobacter welbionis]
MEKTVEQETAKTFQRTRMVVMAAAFAALACVATMVVKVPSPTGGYMNLGDTVVLLGGYLLGPAWGALAGSIGPALADVLLGSPIYAPATLVIKAGMAALAAACHQAFGKGRGPLGLAACGIVGELPMVVGYWLYDALLLGSAAGAAAGIPSNLVQAAFGIAASTLRRRLWAAAPTSGGSSPGCDPRNMEESSPGGPKARRGSFASAGESERCLWRGALGAEADPGRRPDGAEPPARPAGEVS